MLRAVRNAGTGDPRSLPGLVENDTFVRSTPAGRTSSVPTRPSASQAIPRDWPALKFAVDPFLRHGRTVYDLRLDFGACQTAIAEAPSRDVANALFDVALRADL